MPRRLILLRHGRSEFARLGLFTGWYDCELSDQGRDESHRAASLMASASLAPTVVHTSRLDRTVETSQIVLRDLRRGWIDVRRSWRLNTLHTGDYTGLSKEFVKARDGITHWPRDFAISRPPPVRDDNELNPNAHPMYCDLPPGSIPRHESLADLERRVLPYWHDALVPDLRAGHAVLVVASGIPLTVLMKLLDGGGFVADGKIPIGVPFLYELDDGMAPLDARHPLERALDTPAASTTSLDVTSTRQ